MMPSDHTAPEPDPSLIKEIPGQIFSFEETIFGMSLPQMLCDLGGGVCLLAATGGLALEARIVLCTLLVFLLLVLVHAKVREQSLLHWLFLAVRFRLLPTHTTWQALDAESAGGKTRGQRTQGPSIQTTWIPLDSLSHGIAGYTEPGGKGPQRGRYWVVLEVTGRAVGYLPELEQIRFYSRYEAFLTGLSFRLQCLSLTEQVQSDAYPPLLVQEQAVARLHTTPQLAALQRASIAYQRTQLPHCTLTRHFLILSVSAREAAAEQPPGGTKRGPLSFLWQRMLSRGDQQVYTREHLLTRLRIRLSVLHAFLQQIDVRCWLLDDTEFLSRFAACLVPGAALPSFRPHLVEDAAHNGHDQEERIPGARVDTAAPSSVSLGERHQEDAGYRQEPLTVTHGPTGQHQSPQLTSRSSTPPHVHRQWAYRKTIRGLHTSFAYTSASAQRRVEAGVVRLADLLAPSSIDLYPDAIEMDAAGQKRYIRTFAITGYGTQKRCGWVSALTDLGLPMIISTLIEPIDTDYMLHKLETHLVKLESRRVSDQKTLRLPRAAHSLEAAQIRRMARLLSARKVQVCAVQLTIALHAGSRERLEERSAYLLPHLRQQQLTVRQLTRRQDIAWQSILPLCPPLDLATAVNVPADALSASLHCVTGSIGTPTGVFLGFSGRGTSRRPIFYNPWSPDKKLANPHMVIVGESGMGKSFVIKAIVTGIMGLGLADVVVLDRDDDYLPLHSYLDAESQRYNLARGCPLNFFDLPYGPDDVDPDDPSDLLAEYIDNHLLTGLALVVSDAGVPLTRAEEAYLMHVARTTYAANGITSEAIRHAPRTLLRPMPTLTDFIATLRETPAASKAMRSSLLERLEKAAYLFSGQTSIAIDKPLTIFSIRDLDEKWYPLMTFTVQNFLLRHRAVRRDERYLAYVVEEASYMLKHPAGRKYLETGSRGFRKLGIAQFTLSQHPAEFLQEGAVILANAGTALYLGMQPSAATLLQLAPELERTLTAAVPGQAVMRVGNEYAAIQIATSPLHATLFTTDPEERRLLRAAARQRGRRNMSVSAEQQERSGA